MVSLAGTLADQYGWTIPIRRGTKPARLIPVTPASLEAGTRSTHRHAGGYLRPCF